MTRTARSIMVGVTGSGENTDALRYAAQEAAMTGLTVTLVHASESMLPPLPPSVWITPDVLVEAGKRVVHEVREEFETLFEGVPVETHVAPGEPGRVLGELTDTAALVVLQHRSRSSVQRLLTGSTVAMTAAHARCPVVSVPAGASARTRRVVVAGLRENGGPREVAEAAFREADRRHSSVRLIHGWHLAPAYDGLLLRNAAWQESLQTSLDTVAGELGAKYPGLVVATAVAHDWPADVLVAASREADLLVLGRHSGTRLVPPRLGSLGRAVVAHAECPVMVLPV